MFASLDKDGDGILSKEDLWDFIKSIDYPLMKEMTWEAFEDEVYSRCLDGRRNYLYDVFTRDDFVEFMEEFTIKMFFKEADLDGDGVVTFEDVLVACVKKGLKDISYSDIAAMKMLFDTKTSELLNFRDIVKTMKECKFTPGKQIHCG